MSKLTLMFAVPAVLGLGALAAWNLSLQADLDQMRDRAVEAAEADNGVAQSARRTSSGPVMSERTSSRLRQLEARLNSVEARGSSAGGGATSMEAGALSAASAESADSADDAIASLAASMKDAPDAEFKSRVYAALDEREERRRQERREREAARMAERMLRGIEASDQQVAQVSATMLDYFGQRDALRGQQDLEPEAKRARFKELSDARNTTIEGIVGAEAYAEVKKRVERRAMDNRRKNKRDKRDRKRDVQ